MTDLHLNITPPLDIQMAQFKSDPDKMNDVNDFLNELFKKAIQETEQRKGIASKNKESNGLQNGSKKIGLWSNRARSSARVFATRIITTICNCTNTVKNVVANRN